MFEKVNLSHRNILYLFFAVSLFFFIFSISQTVFALPNPAAVYCEKMGYEYKIIKTPDGEKGVCVVAKDIQFDAWDFFRGKVGREYSYCAKQGYKTETQRDYKKGFSTECAVCVSTPEGGKKAERIPMLKLMENNGEPLLKTDLNIPNKKGSAECEECQQQKTEECDTCSQMEKKRNY